MFKWLMRRKIAAFERAYNYDMSYVRELLDTDPAAFRLFGKIMGMAQYRRDIPLDAWFAAKLAGTLSEDCGPCTQLGVLMAERAGVSPATLRAILARDVAAMPEPVALAFRFAEASLAHDAIADEFRDKIVARWGQRALLSLAFGLTAARLFPTMKYALGHGQTCTRINVGGAPVPVLRRAA